MRSSLPGLTANDGRCNNKTHLFPVVHHGTIPFTVHDEGLGFRHIVWQCSKQDHHDVCKITRVWPYVVVTWRRLCYEHRVTCHAFVSFVMTASAEKELPHQQSCRTRQHSLRHRRFPPAQTLISRQGRPFKGRIGNVFVISGICLGEFF